MTDKNPKIAVTIAGNDSDGSAGMPADLHSFMHVAFTAWDY